MNKDEIKTLVSLTDNLEKVHPIEKFKTFVELLKKVVSNILKNPNEEKYRSLKKSNQTLLTKLFIDKNVDAILLTLHFVEESPGVFIFFEDNTLVLEQALTILEGCEVRIEATLNNIGVDQEIALERLKKVNDDLERKKKLVEDIGSKVHSDRKDLSDEFKLNPIKTSIANERSFGATVKTCKDILPPPSQRK